MINLSLNVAFKVDLQLRCKNAIPFFNEKQLFAWCFVFYCLTFQTKKKKKFIA